MHTEISRDETDPMKKITHEQTGRSVRKEEGDHSGLLAASVAIHSSDLIAFLAECS